MIGSARLFHAGWICHAVRWIRETKECPEYHVEELVRCLRGCGSVSHSNRFFLLSPLLYSGILCFYKSETNGVSLCALFTGKLRD